MDKKLNRNPSARTKADSDKKPIVNTSATILPNPILCLQLNKFGLAFIINNLKEQGQNKIVKPYKHKAFLTRLSLPPFSYIMLYSSVSL